MSQMDIEHVKISFFASDTTRKRCFGNVFVDNFILECLENSWNIFTCESQCPKSQKPMKMKALVATMISLALTTVVIGNAYYQKKQFYPSVVYLTNSNPSMAVSISFHISTACVHRPCYNRHCIGSRDLTFLSLLEQNQRKTPVLLS